MNWKDQFPSRWLKADDLPEDDDLTLTVESITKEVVGAGDNKEEKLIVWFEEMRKGLPLNKTNAEAIASVMQSDETDDWRGKKLRLFTCEVDAFGKLTLAVRVRVRGSRGPTDNELLRDQLIRQFSHELVQSAIVAHVGRRTNIDVADLDTLQNIKAHLERNPQGCTKCALKDPYSPEPDSGDPFAPDGKPVLPDWQAGAPPRIELDEWVSNAPYSELADEIPKHEQKRAQELLRVAQMPYHALYRLDQIINLQRPTETDMLVLRSLVQLLRNTEGEPTKVES